MSVYRCAIKTVQIITRIYRQQFLHRWRWNWAMKACASYILGPKRHAIERASSDLVHWPSLATGNIVHSSTSKSVSISLTLFLLWILSILTKSYKNLHWKCITSEQHQNAHFGNALSRPAGRAYPHAPQTS